MYDLIVSWQLAEQAGCENPYAFQYLLGRVTWDVSRLRDSVRQYVVSFMPQEECVLSIDETGFLKKGSKSAGILLLVSLIYGSR